MLEPALRYAAHGWRVHAKRGKSPLRGSHGAYDATTDTEQIRRWFAGRGGLNVAIALDDLVVLDIDPKPEGMRWHAEHRQLDGLTLTCRSGGGGYHLYFRRPENVDLVGVVTKGVDLLKGKGQSVLAPPSIHPMTGCIYEWIRSWPRSPQPMPPWLIGLCRRPLVVVPRRDEPRAVNHETQLERAYRYAQRVEGAVSGSGGHRHTLLLAMKLAGTFPGLDFGDLWEILAAWNQTCLPPWNQRELQHKLQDALRHTRGWVAA